MVQDLYNIKRFIDDLHEIIHHFLNAVILRCLFLLVYLIKKSVVSSLLLFFALPGKLLIFFPLKEIINKG